MFILFAIKREMVNLFLFLFLLQPTKVDPKAWVKKEKFLEGCKMIFDRN